jgi:peptidoglycan/LPS O-acetylase OafA/YrhL
MQLKLFPAERINADYPWSLWAIGWLAIFKAVLWLAYEPVIPETILRLVGWKYFLGAVPMLICGVALWRRRRWAAWGLAVLAAAGLVLIVVVPPTLQAYLVDSEVMIFSILLSAVVLVCAGPVGDVLILCGVPAMFRNTRKTDR